MDHYDHKGDNNIAARVGKFIIYIGINVYSIPEDNKMKIKSDLKKCSLAERSMCIGHLKNNHFDLISPL